MRFRDTLKAVSQLLFHSLFQSFPQNLWKTSRQLVENCGKPGGFCVENFIFIRLRHLPNYRVSALQNTIADVFLPVESSNDGCDNFLDAALEFAVVSDGRTERDLSGGGGRDAAGDELSGVNQEAGGDAFFQAMTS